MNGHAKFTLFTILAVVAAPFAGGSTPAQERFSFFQASTPESVQRLLTLAELRDDDVVVDLGSGDGLIPLTAARMNPRLRGWGVDIDQKLVERSNERAKTEGVADRVEVKTGDARQLPFPDASFNAVVSSMALHNIYDEPGRRQAVAEIARVLKPGGRVLIVDIRHSREYAEELRRLGLPDAAARRSPLSYLATIVTFGSLRTGTVTGQKASG